MKKKNKKPLKTLSKLKKDLWKLVSIYVRVSEANGEGLVRCVTCGKWLHWTKMQAGHFIDGRTNSILYDLRGVHPQDIRCNIFLSGNKVEYTLYMQKRYGQEVVDELRQLRKTEKKYLRHELEDMIADFKERLKKYKHLTERKTSCMLVI